MKDFPEKLLKYVLGIVLAICGFLITSSYNKVSNNLAELNRDIVSMKLQLVELNSSIIDEERVKDIVETELLKHGIK